MQLRGYVLSVSALSATFSPESMSVLSRVGDEGSLRRIVDNTRFFSSRDCTITTQAASSIACVNSPQISSKHVLGGRPHAVMTHLKIAPWQVLSRRQRQMLAEIDPDMLSPREALDAIYRLVEANRNN